MFRTGKQSQHLRARCRSVKPFHRHGTGCVRVYAFMGNCTEKATATANTIREAIAHSTCAPYSEIADEETMIINPPWADEPRTTGVSHGVCGVTTPTEYTEEHVRPIAAGHETDGSVFLLWERRAQYNGSQDGKPHTEDICGVTYVKQRGDDKAAVIATFRQPSQEELKQHFTGDREVYIRPGSDNFFDGKMLQSPVPVFEQQMVAAVREFYKCWELGKAEERLSHIADPRFRVKEPMWEVEGAYLPVNRVEAALWMERTIKNAHSELQFTPKAIVPCEGSNMVFSLWFAKGLDDDEIAGVHVFFFGDDMRIRSLAAFREPTKRERKVNLKKYKPSIK